MGRVQVAGVIIERDGRIIMQTRSYEPGKGKINFIGGYLEDGETPEQAAVREAKEETGFDVKLISGLGEFEYFDRGDKTIRIFLAEIVGGEMTNSAEGRPVWVDPKTLNPTAMAFPQMFSIISAYLEQRNGREQ